ncbi:hypothetical protein X941_5551 [Burkholderia pseudomallei MSHR5569]|nr:hypothetical protein X941_5551 [Burkholderia pseudomallei MSHR5569]
MRVMSQAGIVRQALGLCGFKPSLKIFAVSLFCLREGHVRGSPFLLPASGGDALVEPVVNFLFDPTGVSRRDSH